MGTPMTSDAKLGAIVAFSVVAVLLALIASFTFNTYYANATTRIAIEKGMCEVRNGENSMSYHWEQCPPK